MKTAKEIGVDEWLVALEAATKKNDAGMTAQEIGDAAGHNVKWARERIAKAMAMGRVTVGYRTMNRIDGRIGQVPVYRFTKAKK